MPDAVIMGAARGVWTDFRAASAYLKAPEVFAVNMMVVIAPEIHHAVSHHADSLVDLVSYRKHHTRLKHQVVTTHASLKMPGIDRVWTTLRDGDSSLLATRIALALGFDRVILAGVPLDGGGHVYSDPAIPVPDFARYRVVWAKFRDEFAGRVWSMSGFTRELLGAPA